SRSAAPERPPSASRRWGPPSPPARKAARGARRAGGPAARAPLASSRPPRGLIEQPAKLGQRLHEGLVARLEEAGDLARLHPARLAHGGGDHEVGSRQLAAGPAAQEGEAGPQGEGHERVGGGPAG